MYVTNLLNVKFINKTCLMSSFSVQEVHLYIHMFVCALDCVTCVFMSIYIHLYFILIHIYSYIIDMDFHTYTKIYLQLCNFSYK